MQMKEKFFNNWQLTLRKKCSYSKLFWSTFPVILIRIRENVDENNSGHFLHSVIFIFSRESP